MTHSRSRAIALFLLLSLVVCLPAGSQARAAAELVMVEQANCHWCHKWDAEIGVTYDRTPVGQIAPLRRVDLHEPKPVDLAHINLGRATPVFILVEDGDEIGRVRGYPGEQNFWLLLKEQLVKLRSLRSPETGAGAKKTRYSSSDFE